MCIFVCTLDKCSVAKLKTKPFSREGAMTLNEKNNF